MEQFNYVSEHSTGYIQIFNDSSKNNLMVMITGEKQFLKVDSPTIKIIETIETKFNNLFPIFSHGRNLVLDVEINSGQMVVYGDYHLVVFNQQLPKNISVQRTPIILNASRQFIETHGLPPFWV
jgi:hypothetical protein